MIRPLHDAAVTLSGHALKIFWKGVVLLHPLTSAEVRAIRQKTVEAHVKAMAAGGRQNAG